jgi:hypothetical protein
MSHAVPSLVGLGWSPSTTQHRLRASMAHELFTPGGARAVPTTGHFDGFVEGRPALSLPLILASNGAGSKHATILKYSSSVHVSITSPFANPKDKVGRYNYNAREKQGKHT